MIYSNPTAIACANAIAIHANSIKAISDHIFYPGAQASENEIKLGHEEIVKSCIELMPAITNLHNHVAALQNQPIFSGAPEPKVGEVSFSGTLPEANETNNNVKAVE